jgi:hypothetical protein
MNDRDWERLSGTISVILSLIYGGCRDEFEEEARQRRVPLESLAAATITQMLRERLEGGADHKR